MKKIIRFKMKSTKISSLLLLLFLIHWDQVNGLCVLDKQPGSAAQCHDLEDVRYINVYHLHTLRTTSSSPILQPGHFKNLTSLRHLDLFGGNIETIESGSFSKLISLQTLNLTQNRIRNLEAGAFDGLKNLHSLRLGSNAIKQLPAALMILKNLKLLDLANNPLNCNCASMKLRDVLLARGVKISKKTQCAEPASVRYMSILKPDTKTTCVFEEQDLEMQGDQPIEDGAEASGEAEVDADLEEAEKDLTQEEREIQPTPSTEEDVETAAPHVTVSTSEEISSSTTASTTSEQVSVTEAAPSSTASVKDDITFDDSEDPLKKESTTEISAIKAEKTDNLMEEDEDEDEDNDDLITPVQGSKEVSSSEENVLSSTSKTDDIIVPVFVSKEDSSTEDITASASTTPKPDATNIIVPTEGSGESDDDGSGLMEGSGLIAHMPSIDFNDATEEEEAQTSSTSTSTTTSTESTWFGVFSDGINMIWGQPATTKAPATTTTVTTEKSQEEVLKAEQFLPVTDPSTLEPVVSPKIIVPDENTSKRSSPMTSELPKQISNDINAAMTDNVAEVQEPKKGIGSYIVLAALIIILTGLIGFAAYKGDFCRKKRKRRDVERGTEMKDMQRSLLDQNTQPKVQPVSNGNTLENVPLMNSSAPPEEPKENQRTYDVTPSIVTNGSSKPNGPTIEVNDPVKPPRKAASPDQIEAPLNGLNPPMDAIDGPTHDPDDMLNNGDYCEKPPHSPGAQRVKITLQENPDSVPKTPILITRLKGGENFVKTP